MYFRKFLICLILGIFILADVGARKSSSSGSRSKGGWSSIRSKSTPRPRTNYQPQPQNSGGSQPGKIGWNVPESDKTHGSNFGSKPSAPQQEFASKASAPNLQQSAYNPSGGYSHNQPQGNPYGHNSYNPSGGYNPTVGGGYNPTVGGGYNPSVGGGYNPSVGGGYNPVPHSQPYNPSYGQHYGGQPSYSQPAAPQTIYVQSAGQPYKPGLGQLAKEAFVYAGVSAGVNAAVNRILPGGIHNIQSSSGSSGGSGGVGVAPAPAPASGGVSHTQITYNYYNGSGPSPAESNPSVAAPANNAQNPAPAAAPQSSSVPTVEPIQNPQNSPKSETPPAAASQDNPLGYVTSNEDIKKLTEEIFTKDTNNAFNHITIKLQGQKKDDSTTDDASEPLLEVKPEAYEIPTIKALLPLYDNYELDIKTKENVTPEKRREENELMDKLLETDVLKTTMKFLASKGYIPDDEYEFKDTLKRIWFSVFKRIEGEPSSSGFETIFLAEKFDNEIIGLHNWIYYAKQEADKKINYLGYIKETSLGTKGKIIKVRSTLNDINQPVTTIFVGTSPELEMAVYTLCFFTRPNNVCPVSFGGTDFIIIANRVNYLGKDILISAYPDI